MSSINEMMKSFADIAELQSFCEQQHKTILELTRKLDKITEKNKHLESLLQQKTPTLVGEYSPIVTAGRIDEEYEENICRMELKKLHDISLERALTYEETKKVDIFAKLIVTISQKPKGQIINTKNKSTDDLLKLISGESDEQ